MKTTSILSEGYEILCVIHNMKYEIQRKIQRKSFVLPYSAQFDIIICPGQGQWLRGRKLER